jgi:integrase/recombinase XerD
MTGVRFLFRVALRRHDLAAKVYHIKEPVNLPLTLSQEEARRLITVAGAKSLKLRLMLALGYGCGLRAVEVVRQGRRHRQCARHHPRGAVQRPQGPPRHAAR